MEIELVSAGSENEEEIKEDIAEKQISDILQVDNINSIDESKVIELDQIQLVEDEEEEKENNTDWIQSLIHEHVMQAVFARIGERDKLESKRKTWNKIRKVEKV